jgi:hypothetical protein
VTNGNPQPSALETKYRTAALTLVDLPEADELEPDFHPWEPGGRYWRAAKCALIALRHKQARLGDEALTDDERLALTQFASYQAGDKRAFETQTLLSSARYLALRELLHEHGLSL